MIVLTRATQQAASYRPVGGVERCAYCRFYSAPGNCGRIVGPVSPAGWCRYFSRMVWLRMDGGDDYFGTAGPPGATLNLSFLDGTLPTGVTFTRVSTATYLDSTGTMRTAAANVPRFDYNPSTRALNGLLLEESRTNIVLNSGDVSAATWVLGNGGGGTLPTRAGNQTTAPDGTLTAGSMTMAATPVGTAGIGPISSFTATANPYTMSVWLKGSVGGEVTYLSMTPDGVTYYRTAATLTTSWQRFVLSTPNLTAATWYPFIGTDHRDASQAATPAETFYVWGGQLEQGAYATSYIPTTTVSVTRSADIATIASLPGRNASAESYAAEFVLAGINASANPRIVGGSATQLGPLFVNTTAHGATTDLVGTAATANTLTLGAVSKLAANWASPNAGRVCLNAGAVVGAATLTTGFGAMTVPRLMGDSVAADQATGYIRRFRYWPRILSDTELQQVTT